MGEFAEQCHYHDYSVWLAVRSSVLNSFAQIQDVQLKPEAVELLHNGQEDRQYH